MEKYNFFFKRQKILLLSNNENNIEEKYQNIYINIESGNFLKNLQNKISSRLKIKKNIVENKNNKNYILNYYFEKTKEIATIDFNNNIILRENNNDKINKKTIIIFYQKENGNILDSIIEILDFYNIQNIIFINDFFSDFPNLNFRFDLIIEILGKNYENKFNKKENKLYFTNSIKYNSFEIKLSNKINKKLDIFNSYYIDKFWTEKNNIQNETLSGGGSLLFINEYRNKLLMNFIKKYDIEEVFDICGDCNWQHVFLEKTNINYYGFDISSEALVRARIKNKNRKNMLFSDKPIDLCNTIFDFKEKKKRLIIIKEVIQHLTIKQGLNMLKNIKDSKFDYIAITNHSTEFFNQSINKDTIEGGFYENNIFKEPFYFINPLANVDDYIKFEERRGYGNLIIFDIQEQKFDNLINKNIDKFIEFNNLDNYKINYFKNDISIGKTIKLNKMWDKNFSDFYKKYYKENTNILDIGAFIGTNSLLFNKILSKGNKIYSFEPQYFDCLWKNINDNNLQDKINIFNYGLSNKEGFLKKNDINFNKQGNYGGLALTLGHNNIIENNNYYKNLDKVKIIKLDDLELQNISLMKIDVEGMELSVLQGAINTIKNNYPTIFIEIWDSNCWRSNYKEYYDKNRIDIINFLVSLGYEKIWNKNDDFIFVYNK